MKVLLGIAALVAVEYLLIAALVCWHRFCDWRLRRECEALTREFERVMGA